MKRLLKKISYKFSIFKCQLSTNKGFTLIELLIVVAIISALAIAVFVALDPASRLKDAKDARRTADADTILTAIHASIVDNKGALPSNLPAAGTERQLGTGSSGVCTTALTLNGCNTPVATACVDLMTGTQNLSKYLKTMPIDPSGGTTYTAAKTGYSVSVSTDNIVTITACNKEGTGANISVSR